MMLTAHHLSAQDLLMLRSGDEIKAKVMEITNTEIKYKKYDNVNGPTISINKSEVFMIKYENGAKDVFKEETPAASQPRTSTANKNKGSTKITSSDGSNNIQFAIGLLNPIKKVINSAAGYTIISATPPIILSYERSIEQFSVGGMYIYTSAKAEYKTYYTAAGHYSYDYYGNLVWISGKTTSITEQKNASMVFLGVLGNYHIYTADNLDITAGAVLGYASISATGETSTSVVSTRFNAAIHYYFTPNVGLFARGGSWGTTAAFDLGTSIKF